MSNMNHKTESSGVNVDEGDITNSFSNIYYIIKKLLPYIIGCAIIGYSIAWVYYKTLEPQYLVKAKILIKDDQGAGKNMDAFQSLGLLTGSSSVENELEIITTYSIMDKVVNDFNLNVNVKRDQFFNTRDQKTYDVPWEVKIVQYTKDVFKKSSGYSYEIVTENNKQYILVGENKLDFKWNVPVTLPVGTLILVRQSGVKIPEAKWILSFSKPSQTVEGYMGSIIPSAAGKNTNIINLMMTTPNPVKGKLVMDRLINTYIEEGVKDNNSINDSTMVFINERLGQVTRELQDVEQAIQSFKQKNKLTDIEQQANMILSETADNSKKLFDAELQLNLVSSLDDFLRKSSNAQVVPSTLLSEDPMLSSLMNQYNTLVVQKERLGKTATSENPMMQSINTQIGTLRSELLSSIRSTKNSYANIVGQLRAESSRNMGLIHQMPEQEREFLDISRQQAIKQELFLFLLKKREETAIGKSSTLSDVRIIDHARIIENPVGPNRNMILLGGLLLGAMIPLVIYLIRKLTNLKLETKRDIKNSTKMPIIGEIGHQANAQIFEVLHHPRSSVAEQFRIVRTNLHFYQKQGEATAIMLTSSMPGEGKTFISLNLAATLAANKEVKVLVMGMDLRKPQMAKDLHLKNQKGFSDYAINDATLDEIIYEVEGQRNLFVIPSGTVPPNPAELLMSKEAKALFSEVKKRFDFIVIDCPPIIVTDYQLISNFADLTLYVSRIGYTEKRQLELADELFRSGKLPKMNLVVNDFNPEKYDGYNSNYYSQYGYYDTEEEKKSFLQKLLGR